MSGHSGLPRPPRMARLALLPGVGRQRRMPGLGPSGDQQQPQQDQQSSAGASAPPLWWQGSPAEWTVHSWLTQKQVPFSYRPSFGPTVGGTGTKSGAQQHKPAFLVADRSPGLVIEVQQDTGYLTSTERQNSIARQGALEAAGYTYVGVRASDVQGDTDVTLGAALDGSQRF